MVDPPFTSPKPNLPFLVTSLTGQNSNSVMTPEGNCSKPNGKANVSVKSRSEGMKQNKFLIVTLKLYMLTSRQIRLSRFFARENGIKKAEEIILVDKHGVKWPSYLASTNQQDFYMTKCWINFCAANGLKIGETFTLEFVRGKDTTPMFKFCSKAEVKIEQEEEEEGQAENETRVPKRARVSAEGEPSCPTRASNKSRVDSRNLRPKQPLQPCSISDLVTKVKFSIVDALNGVKRFRSELDIKEKNLEALLHEIDASGEKVFEMEKILKYHHI